MSNRTDALQECYLRRIPVAERDFRYVWPDGRPYRDRRALARIASLAVPPGWTDVFVSPDPDEELQAFGRDARGRLQYRYHPDFVQNSAMRKWRRLARFAEALPKLREITAADLRLAGLPRRKVLAVLTRLLDRVHFRVGSSSYVRQYRSYGLTTLCKRHVRLHGMRLVFSYRGKHGVAQYKELCDRALAANVERLFALRGPALFQYEDEQGLAHPVRAADLNAYIREAMGPFTAKDFRTWGGTLKAAEYLARIGPVEGERAAGRVLVQCVKAVAAELGNTSAVTRGSYICPVIFDRYLEGRVLEDLAPGDDDGDGGLSRSEQALCRMLRSRARRSKCAARAMRDEDRRPCCRTRAMRALRIPRNFAVRAAPPAGYAPWR